MASVDVSSEIDILAAPADVAAVMFDPEREPEWMSAVTKVELIERALAPGARVKRSGTFLGRPITWMTTVEMLHFPHVLAMRLGDGPFEGLVRYDIQRSGAGSRVRIRNIGELSGAGTPAAAVTGPIREALAADLARLKRIVETKPSP
jgi:Polyketide cyclase / dehydrase and lipid transport